MEVYSWKCMHFHKFFFLMVSHLSCKKKVWYIKQFIISWITKFMLGRTEDKGEARYGNLLIFWLEFICRERRLSHCFCMHHNMCKLTILLQDPSSMYVRFYIYIILLLDPSSMYVRLYIYILTNNPQLHYCLKHDSSLGGGFLGAFTGMS